MKIAYRIKKLDDFRGDAWLYKLSEPMPHSEYRRTSGETNTQTDYVAVSAVNIEGIGLFGGPETYIFPCDSEGVVYNMIEMEGSYKGGLCHSTALEGAGYVIVDGHPNMTEELYSESDAILKEERLSCKLQRRLGLARKRLKQTQEAYTAKLAASEERRVKDTAKQAVAILKLQAQDQESKRIIARYREDLKDLAVRLDAAEKQCQDTQETSPKKP